MSTRRTSRRTIAAVLVALTGLLGSAGPAGAVDDFIPIATGEFTNDVSDAYTDGTHVAWVYGADSPSVSCNTLNAAPLAAPDDVTSETIVRRASFAVANGVLLWEHRVQECHQYTPVAAPGIYGRDLASGAELVITTEPTEELRAAGNTVVWTVADGANVSAIRMANVAGGEAQTIVEFDPPTEVTRLRFDGERVAWAELRGDAWRVMSMVPGAEPAELLPTSQFGWFDIAGDWLVWQEEALLQARNLDTGETLTLAEDASAGPATDGRYVLWVSAPDFRQATVRAYDLATGSRFTVVNYAAASEEETVGVRGTSIRGGALAWDVFIYPTAGTQIRAAFLKQVLPSARRPDPGTTDPNWSWFPETGHYLAYGFRDYWNASGGLPVFGFPLTGEFSELNADTGAERTVQYLERQRFEWHPELAGTPYEVLLGRLGAEQAADLGLLDSEPFQPAPIAGGETPGCLYFPETLHYACAEFLAYWQAHGLEFGDAGVSFRESLALFGFPLSEPFMTTNADGDTVLTQYFERAVFELHPDNPPDHQALLRRLGAEALTARGW